MQPQSILYIIESIFDYCDNEREMASADMQMLKYSPELAMHIDQEKFITSESDLEIELRMATVQRFIRATRSCVFLSAWCL